jgi:hypothetical protein
MASRANLTVKKLLHFAKKCVLRRGEQKRMSFLIATVVSVQYLSVFRNIGFLVLNCGALGSSIFFSLKASKAALYWLGASAVVAITLFALSLGHLRHQMRDGPTIGGPSMASAPALENTVRESGDTVIRLLLLAAGIYIVLRGLRILVLLSRAHERDTPVTIIRFFVGALLCVGILGVGLSGHRFTAITRPSSSLATGRGP